MASNTTNEFFPDYIVPPGETLQELLEDYDMSQVELAERTGKTTKTISEIIHGKAPITCDTAIQFERVFDVPASFWNNLEKNFREQLAEKKFNDTLKAQASFLKKIPLAFMEREGWIDCHKDKTLKLKAVLDFFGVASFDVFEDIWSKKLRPDVAFRQTEAFRTDEAAVAVWLRKGEIEAQEIECAPYDAKLFRESLKEIRKLTDLYPEEFLERLQEICANCGVAVVLVRDTPNSRVHGATTWKGKKPIIQLCFRHKRNDHFWFSFFHEACHILKHSKKMTFVEYNNHKSDLEREADDFASEMLIPKKAYNEFVLRRRFTESSILSFSKMVGIAPGCVLGRLQHERLVHYGTHLNHLRKVYDWQ